jgi:hypothetical protein
MTATERMAYVRQLRRALRDEEIRRRTRRPKSNREFEIWHQALVVKDEKAAARISAPTAITIVERPASIEPMFP